MTFDVGLRLTKYNQGNPSDVVTHDVAKSCSYRQWAHTEVLCERNYMEVKSSAFRYRVV